MDNLRDLNELAKEVVKNFNDNFDARDCRLPQAFKDKVKTLKSFSVVYNDYSVIIKGDGIRSKDSYVPNQSFYMASYFIEYSYELSKYKQKILPLIAEAGIPTSELTAFFTHERDNGKEDIKTGEDKFVKLLDNIGYNDADREFLIRFVTDYAWWYGSKTIERSDFFNSPVLLIMGLTASSNAAMALIVDQLTQHPELNELLLNQVEQTNHLNMNNNSYQQIFYGAPGTGKSHEVKEKTRGKIVIRTTFHPDSDYSTFVGCYKPAMKENIISKNGETTRDEQIVYRFVPQAFTRAYTTAWNTEEDVFLVIEEINRGNCAQIFGDLFQLLDRKEGVSEYPVEADSDMANYIRGELVNSNRTDFPEGVKEGKRLVLPSNLYIWATMNTSDQSLFPIDSAFKRRWDWKYMPIEDAGMGWMINVNEREYNWYHFLEVINKEVLTLTGSEDKQLGYFFAKAKNGVIDADTLVNKVYFYLWTDVFKDCDYDSQKAFRKPNSNEPIAFKDFFEGREVNSDMAEQILINLGLYPIGAE